MGENGSEGGKMVEREVEVFPVVDGTKGSRVKIRLKRVERRVKVRVPVILDHCKSEMSVRKGRTLGEWDSVG